MRAINTYFDPKCTFAGNVCPDLTLEAWPSIIICYLIEFTIGFRGDDKLKTSE